MPPRSHGDSHAELLLARALERAERERALLRNVCLALMGLLGLTLAWLIISALRGEPTPAPSAPAPTIAPAPPAPGAPTVAAAPASAASRLDRARFASEVQPVLAARCADCHSFVGRGGNLLLAHGADPATVAANFEAAARFVLPDGPERSPLLLKPLPPEEGGQPHGAGGAVLRAAEPAWKALQAWATSLAPPGAAPTPAAPPVAAAPAAPRPGSGGKNRAPTAAIAPLPGPGVVGQALELDAAGSTDPDGDGLRFRWLLARRPDGSQARLEGGDGPRARLVPDRPGAYEVAVVVHDGTDSARAALPLQVGTGPPAAAPAEAAPADVSREVALAKAVERLTGQRPGGAELAQLVALERPALISALLERPALFERWWDEEQGWLLDGPTRPKGEPWASMPGRLREGRVGVKDVQYALAVGRDWSGRWAGKPEFVGAVLERLLGLDEAAAKAARPAAERMYDGYEAELFGQKGSSQADLVRIAAKDPRARRHALLRAWRRATGRDPEPAALDAALARLEGEPQAFFRILAEAACRDL